MDGCRRSLDSIHHSATLDLLLFVTQEAESRSWRAISVLEGGGRSSAAATNQNALMADAFLVMSACCCSAASHALGLAKAALPLTSSSNLSLSTTSSPSKHSLTALVDAYVGGGARQPRKLDIAAASMPIDQEVSEDTEQFVLSRAASHRYPLNSRALQYASPRPPSTLMEAATAGSAFLEGLKAAGIQPDPKPSTAEASRSPPYRTGSGQEGLSLSAGSRGTSVTSDRFGARRDIIMPIHDPTVALLSVARAGGGKGASSAEYQAKMQRAEVLAARAVKILEVRVCRLRVCR